MQSDASSIEKFAVHLKSLANRSGRPSVRALADKTGYGKTVIADALAGRKLPTWAVVESLGHALGADVTDLRTRWLAASAASSLPPRTSWQWLIEFEGPSYVPADAFAEQIALALDKNARVQAVCAAWDQVHSAARAAAALVYHDTTDNWTASVPDVVGRLVSDGRLPANALEAAHALHQAYVRVASYWENPALPSPIWAIRYMDLAWRLTAAVRDIREVRQWREQIMAADSMHDALATGPDDVPPPSQTAS